MKDVMVPESSNDNPACRRYAVIGQPIAHSLSPAIHRRFAAAAGIDLEYDAFEVAPEALAHFWRNGSGRDLAGCNVTLPLKEAMARLCDQVSDRACEASAVNTVSRRSGDLIGDNTDGIGLLSDLIYNRRWSVRGQRIAIIGAGGAAAGILSALLGEKPDSITIINRSVDRGQALANRFEQAFNRWDQAIDEPFAAVVQTTSAGYNAREVFWPDIQVRPDGWIYELNYGQAAFACRRWADSQGVQFADGFGMLVEQAAESFRIWHGERPPEACVNKLLADGPDALR